MLPPKEVYRQKRNLAYVLLIFECESGIYDGIRTVYEQGKINNNMLIRELGRDRMVSWTPQETLYFDMAAVAYALSKDNPAIVMALEGHCRTNYPGIVETIEMFEKKDKEEGLDRKDIAVYFLNLGKEDKLKSPEYAAFLFLLYCSDVMNESGMLEEINQLTIKANEDLMNSRETDNLTLMFSETDEKEDIFGTKQFRRWYDKRKDALYQYCCDEVGVEPGELELKEVLLKLLMPMKMAEIPLGIDCNEGYVPGWVTRWLFIRHHGGINWIEELIGDEFNLPATYIPDTDALVEMYYKTLVSFKSFRKKEWEGTAMSRYYLAREFETRPEDDLRNLAYIFYLDVVLKMFDEMTEEYYRNFSWEQIAHKPLLARYQNNITDLQKQLNQMNSKAQSLIEENISLKSQIKKSGDDAVRAIAEENLRLLKKIETKDEEILRLRNRVQSMEELMALQLTEDDEEGKNAETINMDLLQAKRYLFVGYDVPALKELKRMFPGSAFMESETFTLTNLHVDAVVILIRNISHAMYYKVISSKSLMDLPVVRVNTRNIKTIYKEMQNCIISNI